MVFVKGMRGAMFPRWAWRLSTEAGLGWDGMGWDDLCSFKEEPELHTLDYIYTSLMGYLPHGVNHLKKIPCYSLTRTPGKKAQFGRILVDR